MNSVNHTADVVGNGRRRLKRFTDTAPEFVKRLEPFFETDEGSTCCFECHCTGFPIPSVSWQKDSETIPTSHPYYKTEYFSGVARLCIAEVVKEDEGAYRCKAENREGAASTTAYMTVKEDKSKKLLSQQQKEQPSDHVISLAPHLRTITEQKSLEEREAEAVARQPPSPLQDFIDSLRRDKTWPLYPPLRRQAESMESQGSDLSVESEDSQGRWGSGSSSANSQTMEIHSQRSIEELDQSATPTDAAYTNQHPLASRTGQTQQQPGPAGAARSSPVLTAPVVSLQDLVSLVQHGTTRTADMLDCPLTYLLLLVSALACLGAATGLQPYYFALIVLLMTVAFLIYQSNS